MDCDFCEYAEDCFNPDDCVYLEDGRQEDDVNAENI